MGEEDGDGDGAIESSDQDIQIISLDSDKSR